MGMSRSEVKLATPQAQSYGSYARRRAPAMTNEQMREHVYQAAMTRYVEDLKDEVAKSHEEKEFMEVTIARGKVEEQEHVVKRRELFKKHQEQVLHQIEENKKIRARRRVDQIEAQSAHGCPLFTETFISQPEVDQYMKDRKQKMRDDLDAQRKMTNMLRNIVVKRDKEWAEQVLQNNVSSMINDRRVEREKKLNLREAMRRNWDRDIQLRNVKKVYTDAARKGSALDEIDIDAIAAPPADVMTLP